MLGLGLTGSVLIGLILLIPFLGGLLATAVAPILLVAGFHAIHASALMKRPLPPGLRGPAFLRSPLILLTVLRDGRLTLPLVATCITALIAALVINILVRMIAGPAWVQPLASLAFSQLLGVAGGMTVGFLLYSGLAMSILYALPLVMFHQDPLFPAARRSLQRSLRYSLAMLIMLLFSLAPLWAGIALGTVSEALGFLAAILCGAIVLPLSVAGFYCAYLDLCQPHPADHPG